MATETQTPDPTLVTTSTGRVRGSRRPDGVLFGGIPYAQAPDGDLRYRPPVAPEPWDGELDATRVGPPAPQPARVLPGLDARALLGDAATEPTLTVNVWTPDPGAAASGAGLPVLVWVHGGAFVAGSPGQPVYGADAFLRDGVVVVGVTYRLGVEGFVPFESGTANLALHDVLAALAWVQREIAAFGGDPGAVTLAGQSAGAFITSWLLGTPRSKGLFRRAVVLSGGCDLTLTPGQAGLSAAHVAGLLGVEPTAEAMRGVPVADVVAAQGSVQPGDIDLTASGDPDPSNGLVWIGAVRDGDLVAEDPLAAIGSGPDVALLTGVTAEEGLLYVAGRPDVADLPSEVVEQLAAGITEEVFHGPSRRLVERHARVSAQPTYGYRFDWRSSALGGRLGAAHAVDLPFVFDTLDAPGWAGTDAGLLGPEGGDPDLARRLHAAVAAFVRTGDPGFAVHPHVEAFG